MTEGTKGLNELWIAEKRNAEKQASGKLLLKRLSPLVGCVWVVATEALMYEGERH